MGGFSGKKGTMRDGRRPNRKSKGKSKQRLYLKVSKAVDRYLFEMRKVLVEKNHIEALEFLQQNWCEIRGCYIRNRMMASNFVNVFNGKDLRKSDEITDAEKQRLHLYKSKMPLVIADLVAMEKTIILLKDVVKKKPKQEITIKVISDAGHARAESDDQIAIEHLLETLHRDPLLKNVKVIIVLTSTSGTISQVKDEVLELSQGRMTPKMLDERVTWYTVDTFANSFQLNEKTCDPTVLLRIAPIKDNDWENLEPILASESYMKKVVGMCHMDNNGDNLYPNQKVVARYPTKASSANKSCDNFNRWLNSLPNLEFLREITTPETVAEALTFEDVASNYGTAVADMQFAALSGRMLGLMPMKCPYIAHATRAIAAVEGQSLGMSTEYLMMLLQAYHAYNKVAK